MVEPVKHAYLTSLNGRSINPAPFSVEHLTHTEKKRPNPQSPAAGF